MRDVSIVIPTFREAENLRVLIPRLAAAFEPTGWLWEIVVVDDASPDDTEAVCADLSRRYPVRLIVRRGERGLSSAVIRGMSEASGRVLLCMDADLSHPPEMAPELARRLLDDDAAAPDFVVGSRYVAGGNTEEGWGLFRWLNSQVATWLARPLVDVRDPMAGFFALRRSDFLRHLGELNPVGYKIGLELIVKCRCQRIVEVPIHFANRLHGESKLCLREQANYLRHLGRLYAHRFREALYVLRFGLVGLSGVAVDLACLALLLSGQMPYSIAAALAIWAAMTWNFFGNRQWTFPSDGQTHVLWQYLTFCASCLLGGLLNWSTRMALITWVAAFAERPLAAAGVGVIAGFVSNYVLCRLFVFRSPQQSVETPASKLPGKSAAEGDSAAAVAILQRVVSCGLLCLVLGHTLYGQEQVDVRFVNDKAPQRPAPPPRILSTARPKLDFSDSTIEARLKADATYLASDELEGRGVRTKGLELAAEFIAREFAAAGLQTDLYNGTPYHEFRLHNAGDKGAVQELSVALPNGDTEVLSLGSDYHSLMISPKGAFRLPMAFVGYGITDPERGYDDYDGLNVSGKAVVILRHEPLWPGAEAREGEPPRKHALVMTKIRNAITHGAAAIVLVTNGREYAKQLPQDVPEGQPVPDTPEVLLDVEFNASVGSESLPVVHCRRRLVDNWIRKSINKSLDELERQIEKTLKPASSYLDGASIAARVAVTRSGWTLHNVVGTLPGTGAQADEAIVVGAHFDHLGRGGYGSLAGATDVIHNGADDNASGTAVLMEVARQVAASPHPRNRQVVFVAFSAEELGLIGSRRYAQNPLVPLSHTVAMLNLDMVGRLRNDRVTVYGTGTAVEWPDWLAEAAAPQHLLVIARPSGFGPSDHASFYERGIPVLHFFTGFHPEYHRPNDDSDLLNVAGMRRIAGLLVNMIQKIDSSPSRPRMTSVDEAALVANLNDSGLRTGRELEGGPRLGVVLDTAEVKDGVRVKQLLKFSPAELAGLRAGDVILSIDNQPVKSVDEIQKYLSSRQHGQSVTVEFDRRGTRRQVTLTL